MSIQDTNFHHRLLAILALSCFAWTSEGLGQLPGLGQTQLPQPASVLGGFGESALGEAGRVEAIEERVRSEIENAKYRWGPVLATPSVTFPTLSLNANCGVTGGFIISGEIPEDGEIPTEASCSENFGAVVTAAAGLNLVFPISENWVADSAVGVGYSWYQEDSGRSDYRLNYSVGVHGLFGKMIHSLTAEHTERDSLVSSELQQLAAIETDSVQLRSLVQITEVIDWWMRLDASDQAHDQGLDDDQADLTQRLDRTTLGLRTGLKWTTSRGGFGLIYTIAKAEFDQERDLSSTHQYLGVEYLTSWKHFQFNSRIGVQDVTGAEGSLVSDTQNPAGYVTLGWNRQQWNWMTYGAQGIQFSISADAATVEELRYGLIIGREIGKNWQIRAFADQRRLKYTDVIDPEILGTPITDSTYFGLTLDLPPFRTIRTYVSLIHENSDSALEGFSRTVTYVTGGVRLGVGRRFGPELLGF